MHLDRKPLASKRILSLVLFIVISSSPCAAADEMSWGRAFSGVRVGVSLRDGPAGNELFVAFQNVGNTTQSLFVSQSGGFGPPFISYLFEIVAVGPDRKTHQIHYWVGDSGRLVNVGLISQRVEELPARRTYEFKHSLKDLFEFDKGGDIPLESLLRQGYAVRVDYNVPRDKVTQLSNEHSNLWTGRIQSGEVELARSSR